MQYMNHFQYLILGELTPNLVLRFKSGMKCKADKTLIFHFQTTVFFFKFRTTCTCTCICKLSKNASLPFTIQKVV